MASERMKLVQGDTRPPVVVSLTDVDGPIDLSDGDTVLVMYFRAEGDTTVLATIPGSKLVGKEEDDGTVNTTAPYDVPGKGGRCLFPWVEHPEALAGDPGNYEGEVEITFPDGTIQTGYDLLKFKLRADF